MPRRNTPKGRRPAEREDETPSFDLGSAVHAPAGWTARAVQPANAAKRYTCPFCERPVEPATKHTVAWPIGDESQRRHFHDHCWKAAVRSGRRIPT